MSSEDEDMEYASPDEETQATSSIALPALSKKIYNKTYNDFKKWYNQNGAKQSISEDLMCTYFTSLSTKHKPPTLWNLYSMLKATINLNDNVDIAVFSKLTEFLKKVNVGYIPEKTKKFTEEDIEKFINEAPDEQLLHAKVICIFGINGVNSARKLITVKIEHVKQYADMFLVSIPKAVSNAKFSFTINGTFFNIVKKYTSLRPANTKDNRFFLQYKAGKCNEQPIGINKFSDSPRKIAKFLKLPQPELYTVNAFRINSTKAVANVTGWKSSSTDEHSMQYSLDYETGLLRTSSVDCTSEPVSTIPSFPSNKQPATSTSAPNHNESNKTAHICSLTCGEVKCAKEENEKSVLHAFDVMKPAGYNIAEVTPAQFASDPCCWIVAYTHNSEPVSSFNADETFEDITTSIPYNVTVVQEYIRGNSSQLVPAYVVVYAVACRCQKESSNVFSFTVNEIKCEI